jgi:hypothetical protein
MKTYKLIFTIIINFSPFFLYSQFDNLTFPEHSIEGRILDKKDKTPLAYAHVYNKSSGKGTISNLDGYFKLNVKTDSDIVLISIVGYKKTQLNLDFKTNFYQVQLEESVLLLNEVKVFAGNNSYLYNLLQDCKKSQSKTMKTAKVYFKLKSFIDDKQVELLEGFYNGKFRGYDMTALDLKEGRIALQMNNDRYFLSVETSNIITMMKLFFQNEDMPISPLEFTKRLLKKKYNLSLANIYYSDNLDSIYIVNFTPKDTSHNFFQGQVWVNYSKKNIIKIKLRCLNAEQHPFLPIFSTDSIKNVELDITKSFQEVNGTMLLQHVDFIYQFTYKSRNDKLLKVTTNAILYSYDFNSLFSFPNFIFPDKGLSDYIKINTMPINEYFWKNNEELKLNEQDHKNDSFYNDEYSITNKTPDLLNQFVEKVLEEKPYLQWSTNRILSREFTTENPPNFGNNKTIPESNLFTSEFLNLSIKIFLDINTYKDSLQFITATILDPYESYYRLPINSKVLCLINICFDLVEIERRTLLKDLQKSNNNLEKIKKLYEESLVKIELMKQKFFRETDVGNNEYELKKWNKIVLDNLGINNIELFKPYEDKK